MASAITHFIVGAAVALPVMEAPPVRGILPRWAIPVTAGLFAVAPDLDTSAMFAFHVPRGSFFGHRGFFHSPFFLALLAFGVARRPHARGPGRLSVSCGPAPRSPIRSSTCSPTEGSA